MGYPRSSFNHHLQPTNCTVCLCPSRFLWYFFFHVFILFIFYLYLLTLWLTSCQWRTAPVFRLPRTIFKDCFLIILLNIFRTEHYWVGSPKVQLLIRSLAVLVVEMEMPNLMTHNSLYLPPTNIIEKSLKSLFWSQTLATGSCLRLLATAEGLHGRINRMADAVHFKGRWCGWCSGCS